MKSWVVKIIIIAVLFVGLLIAYAYIKNSHAFLIETVQIKGDYTHVPDALIESRVAPLMAQATFFNLNSDAIREVLNDITWVDHVNVRRVFPSTVVISVYEKNPIAIWNKTELMTAEGVLFAPSLDTFPKNLPQISGPDGQDDIALHMFLQINELFSTLSLSVQSLSVSERHVWEFQLSNGIKIIVGENETLERLQRFIMVYPKIIGNKASQVISVDLRYQHGLAIEWK